MSDSDGNGSEAVRRRLRRYAHLRAVQRALRPAFGPSERIFPPPAAREIREQLRVLWARMERPAAEAEPEASRADTDEELARLDAALEVFAERLRTALDAIPLAQLRAVLPEVCALHREEVEALLDLALSEEGALGPDRTDRIDYLITLLATERVGGRRRRARRPAELVPRLRARAEAAAEALDPGTSEGDAKIFREAAEQVAALQHPEALIAAMREWKETLGRTIFAPPVLEAMVEYNTAVWNRMQGLIADEREVDREAGMSPDPPALGFPAAPRRPPLVGTEPSAIRSDPAPPFRPPAPAARLRKAGPERGWRRPALGLALTALAGMLLLLSGSPEHVRVLQRSELQSISPHLVSGYRGVDSDGATFFGTLSPEWLAKPPPERSRSARAIGEALAERGIERVILFDGRHRLRARWSQGTLELPSPEGASSAAP